MRKTSRIEDMVKKYDHLVIHYAKQILLNKELGLEREDIEQELRIKLYISLAKYSEKWKKFKETGQNKPIDVSVFLKSALKNKVTDIIRSLNAQKHKHEEFASFSSTDISYYSTATSNINFEKGSEIFIINGVDVLINLRGLKREAYILYIKGFTVRELQKQFQSIDIEELIERQRLRLEEKRETLLDYSEQTFILLKNQNEDTLWPAN